MTPLEQVNTLKNARREEIVRQAAEATIAVEREKQKAAERFTAGVKKALKKLECPWMVEFLQPWDTIVHRDSETGQYYTDAAFVIPGHRCVHMTLIRNPISLEWNLPKADEGSTWIATNPIGRTIHADTLADALIESEGDESQFVPL